MTPQQAAAALLFIGIASLPPSSFASEPSGGHVPEVVSLGEFPASGHSYNVDFGEAKFRLDFISDKGLTYTSLVDPIITETVKIVVTPLRQNLFMVVWTEKAEPGSFTSKTLINVSSTRTSSEKTEPLCA
jgi:hypothetical protein